MHRRRARSLVRRVFGPVPSAYQDPYHAVLDRTAHEAVGFSASLYAALLEAHAEVRTDSGLAEAFARTMPWDVPATAAWAWSWLDWAIAVSFAGSSAGHLAGVDIRQPRTMPTSSDGPLLNLVDTVAADWLRPREAGPPDPVAVVLHAVPHWYLSGTLPEWLASIEGDAAGRLPSDPTDRLSLRPEVALQIWAARYVRLAAHSHPPGPGPASKAVASRWTLEYGTRPDGTLEGTRGLQPGWRVHWEVDAEVPGAPDLSSYPAGEWTVSEMETLTGHRIARSYLDGWPIPAGLARRLAPALPQDALSCWITPARIVDTGAGERPVALPFQATTPPGEPVRQPASSRTAYPAVARLGHGLPKDDPDHHYAVLLFLAGGTSASALELHADLAHLRSQAQDEQALRTSLVTAGAGRMGGTARAQGTEALPVLDWLGWAQDLAFMAATAGPVAGSPGIRRAIAWPEAERVGMGGSALLELLGSLNHHGVSLEESGHSDPVAVFLAAVTHWYLHGSVDAWLEAASRDARQVLARHARRRDPVPLNHAEALVVWCHRFLAIVARAPGRRGTPLPSSWSRAWTLPQGAWPDRSPSD